MTEPSTIELPKVTVSKPRQLASGRWRMDLVWEDRPTLKFPAVDDTPEFAEARAREEIAGRYVSILKSLAARYARVHGRLKTIREARQRPAMAEGGV